MQDASTIRSLAIYDFSLSCRTHNIELIIYNFSLLSHDIQLPAIIT